MSRVYSEPNVLDLTDKKLYRQFQSCRTTVEITLRDAGYSALLILVY